MIMSGSKWGHFQGGDPGGRAFPGKDSTAVGVTGSPSPQFFFLYFLDMILILWTGAKSVHSGGMA